MAFITLRIDDKAVRQAIQTAPALSVNYIRRGLTKGALAGQRHFRQNMPVGATGYLRKSAVFSFMNKLTVKVEPEAKYADYVEFGTKPHWTSVHNLERWAHIKGLNPYAIQRSIATHGTKPHPYLEKTYQQTKKDAVKYMEQEMSSLVERINK